MYIQDTTSSPLTKIHDAPNKTLTKFNYQNDMFLVPLLFNHLNQIKVYCPYVNLIFPESIDCP